MWEAMRVSVGVETKAASAGFWLRVAGLQARGVATPVGAPASGGAAADSTEHRELSPSAAEHGACAALTGARAGAHQGGATLSRGHVTKQELDCQ